MEKSNDKESTIIEVDANEFDEEEFAEVCQTLGVSFYQTYSLVGGVEYDA